MSVEGFPTSGRLGTFTVCTSGTHPASPVAGDSLYETDTGKFLQYQSVTTGWTPPWNSDFGVVGTPGTATSSQGLTTIADLTSLTVTFTAIGNRRYRVWGNLYISSNIAADQWTLTLADGSNAVKQTWLGNAAAVNEVKPITPIFDVLGLAAGSQTLKYRLARTTGSGTVTSSAGAAFVASITVEDVGSNGVPL